MRLTMEIERNWLSTAADATKGYLYNGIVHLTILQLITLILCKMFLPKLIELLFHFATHAAPESLLVK
jgi:hypothetical protein